MSLCEKVNNTQLYCDVCEISFQSNAECALHEFTKKHSNNLIKLAKKKRQEKITNEVTSSDTETSKAVTDTYVQTATAGNGCFVSGETCKTDEVSKMIGKEFSPHFQNPSNKKNSVPKGINYNKQTVSTAFCGNKEKKLNRCQICNIISNTKPEYEAHLKSSQHIQKMKENNKDIAAHFVEASSAVHGTNAVGVSSGSQQVKQKELGKSPTSEKLTSGPLPPPYGNVSEPKINTPEVFHTHFGGAWNKKCVQKQVSVQPKKKIFPPIPNQLYCYSCEIPVYNLQQYSAHKNGKKHKFRCSRLIRKGITIPPEERLPDMNMPRINSQSVVYPSLYEKFVLGKQKGEEVETTPTTPLNTVVNKYNANGRASINYEKTQSTTPCKNNFKKGQYDHSSHLKLKTVSDLECHNENNSINSSVISSRSDSNKNDLTTSKNRNLTLTNEGKEGNGVLSGSNEVKSSCDPKFVSKANTPISVSHTKASGANSQDVKNQSQFVIKNFTRDTLNEKCKSQMVIVSKNELIKCSICDESFRLQSEFDSHVSSEEHLQKILELKFKGRNIVDLLNILFSDRRFVKPDALGTYNCGVCGAIARTVTEFEQHLYNTLHKYSEKDYEKKRFVEIKNLRPRNKEGIYFCHSCAAGWSSIVEFAQHLHSSHYTPFELIEEEIQALRGVDSLRKVSMLSLRKRCALRNQRLRIKKERDCVSGILKTDKNSEAQKKIGEPVTGVKVPKAIKPAVEEQKPNIQPNKNINERPTNTKQSNSGVRYPPFIRIRLPFPPPPLPNFPAPFPRPFPGFNAQKFRSWPRYPRFIPPNSYFPRPMPRNFIPPHGRFPRPQTNKFI